MNNYFTVLLKSTSLKIISEDLDLLFELKNLQTSVNQGKGQGEIAETYSSNFILFCLLIRYLSGVQREKKSNFCIYLSWEFNVTLLYDRSFD